MWGVWWSGGGRRRRQLRWESGAGLPSCFSTGGSEARGGQAKGEMGELKVIISVSGVGWKGRARVREGIRHVFSIIIILVLRTCMREK